MKTAKTALQIARIISRQTQVQIAKASGMCDRQYQEYEYGKRTPSVKTAIRIAEALGKDTGDMKELFPLEE